MAKNRRRFACAPDAVFEVLSDAWLYPVWVVGASRMREVDDAWPRVGARLHHSVGTWPFLLNDSTSVEEWDPPRRMTLMARGWPVGVARVHIEVTPDGDGSMVEIREEPVSGPASVVSGLLDPVLFWRNTETLRRLAYVAEGRAGTADRTGRPA